MGEFNWFDEEQVKFQSEENKKVLTSMENYYNEKLAREGYCILSEEDLRNIYKTLGLERGI